MLFDLSGKTHLLQTLIRWCEDCCALHRQLRGKFNDNMG